MSELDAGLTSTAVPGRSRRSPRTTLFAGVALTGLVVAVALLTLFWTPYDPSDTAEGIRLGPPSAQHWLGTDRLGRDLFTQVLVGARLAIMVALGASGLAGLIGVTLGVLAATSKRWLDEGLGYLFDVLIALPALLLAMLVVTVRGASTGSAIMAIGLSFSAVVARVTRVNAAKVLSSDYVRAAIASGSGNWRIVFEHVLPNIAGMLVVQLTLIASSSILVEASLSYLGLGTPPPTASWGRMLLEAQTTAASAPWGAVFPGLAIVITVMGLNFLGDGLREVLDPEVIDD